MHLGKFVTKGLISLGAMCAALSPAAATSYDLGTLAPGTSLSGGSFWVGSSLHTDDYSFEIASPDDSSIALLRINSGMADFTGSLYREGNLIQSFGVLASGFQTTQLGALGGGSYSLVVSGTPTDTSYGVGPAGLYGLALSSVAAAPVPGPAGWLVAGVGLAVVGFAYRRRLTNIAATA